MRRYFIMDTTLSTEQEIADALNSCIGLNETQRYSLDGTKLLIKCSGEHDHSSECCTEYRHFEILPILEGVEWTDPDSLLL